MYENILRAFPWTFWRSLFNIVNTIFGKNKSKKVFPHHDDPKVLANSFNKFYLQKVEQLRSKIPISNQNSQRNSNFRGTIMDCFRPTTVQELRKILKESGIKTSFNDKQKQVEVEQKKLTFDIVLNIEIISGLLKVSFSLLYCHATIVYLRLKAQRS